MNLRRLLGAIGLDVLAQILEMARLEAEQIAKSAADAGGRAA